MREDHVAGRGGCPGPACEDQRQHTADLAKSPTGLSEITDPALVALIDRASDLDRAWFERHPGRAYRVRPEVKGEHLEAVCPRGKLALTLVKQVRPGFRTRLPLWASRRPCSCDGCLDALWERVAPCGLRDTLISMAATAMREGGR